MHIRQLTNLYDNAPLRARLHIQIRSRLFEFSTLEPFLGDEGRFIDVGCGYGTWTLMMAYLRPKSQVVGIDPDHSKILIGTNAILKSGLENVHLESSSAQDLKWGETVFVTFIDVLYLISYDEQVVLLSNAIKNLQIGGRILIKEMSESPKWKFYWNYMEEWLAVKLLKITSGDRFYFRPVKEWKKLLENFGLKVKMLRVDGGYLHPHVLFIGEKY